MLATGFSAEQLMHLRNIYENVSQYENALHNDLRIIWLGSAITQKNHIVSSQPVFPKKN